MNRKLKELISIPPENAKPEDDALLVEELKKAQLIMPIEILSTDEKESEENLHFKPLKIANEEGHEFIALFSDENELIKSNVEFSVINIYTENLAEMIKDSKDEYFGIAVNHSVSFHWPFH